MQVIGFKDAFDMFQLKAITKIVAGVALMILAITALIAWIGACFGTVIVGVVMLLFAPSLLWLPYTLIGIPAMALMGSGFGDLHYGYPKEDEVNYPLARLRIRSYLKNIKNRKDQ